MGPADNFRHVSTIYGDGDILPGMTLLGNFIFICPACGYKARVPEQFSGRSIKCPGCMTPQVANAPLNNEHKTASFIRVAATPVPFTMPQEQIDALTGSPVAPLDIAPLPPRSFPSPLPGAIRVSTDRITKRAETVTPEAPPTANIVRSGTVDFTCTACNAHLRLPGHYAGKSILCPKCSMPQKVVITNLAVPMGTTRSIAASGTSAATSPGTATGIRVRVTPLPATYPTPLPTAMTAPTTSVQGALKPLAAPAAFATAGAAPDVDLAGDIDAIVADVSPTDSVPLKPHPSRTNTNTESIKRSPATAASASAPAAISARSRARSPSAVNLIAVAGGLLVIVIALGAGLTYYALALSETRHRLDQAQLETKAASEATAAREQAAKLRIAELEAALQVATDAAAKLPAAAEGPVTTEVLTPVTPIAPAEAAAAAPEAALPVTPAAVVPVSVEQPLK